MAIEQVREYFRKAGIEERIQEFEVSSATVELAAEALRCEPLFFHGFAAPSPVSVPYRYPANE